MTLGLRERRRRETTIDIRRATLDLVEARGWDAVTVGDIAARAGISTRTFFRYFDSKEQAALPAQRRLWEALSGFTPSSPHRVDIARDLRALLRTAAFDDVEDGDDIDIHGRIARLFQSNPHLHAVAAVQEAAYAQRLHERLSHLLPDEDALSLRALAESSMAMWRTAWWHWGLQLNAEADSRPADSFDAAERALREYGISI